MINFGVRIDEVRKGIDEGHIFSVTTRASTVNKGFVFYMQSNKLNYQIRTHSYWYGSLTSNPFFNHSNFTSNKWYMITLTSDYGVTAYGIVTTKLYINGEFTDILAQDVNPFNTDDFGAGIRFTFGGALDYGSKSLQGISMTIDNLRFYNTRVLAEDEIMEIYESESREWE